MNIGLMAVRKGSKRLPDKCLLPFNGSTLFEYSLDKTLEGFIWDKFYVISNDERIEKICKKYPPINFIQEPERLANQDNTWNVIKWFIGNCNLNNDNILFLLPPTAPLRSPSDVEGAYRLFMDNYPEAEGLVSVCKCIEPPQWSFYLDGNYLHLHDFPMTSQQLNAHFYLNGAIYIGFIKDLLDNNGFFCKKTLAFIMPKERSVDIDYKHEFDYAEWMVFRQGIEENLEQLKPGEGSGKWIS